MIFYVLLMTMIFPSQPVEYSACACVSNFKKQDFIPITHNRQYSKRIKMVNESDYSLKIEFNF